MAFVAGYMKYSRGQAWKRAEFLAQEMKDLLSDPEAATALTMIDWAVRKLRLYSLDGTVTSESVVVTYDMQCRAVRPHTFIDDESAAKDIRREMAEDGYLLRAFTREEAIIRDCYDRLLDRFDRLGSYVQTGLVTSGSLRPYIGYWIDDIAAAPMDPDEAMWSLSLLTYIYFYNFIGVVSLFRCFGYDIGPDGRIFDAFLQGVAPSARDLALRLQDAARSAVKPY